MTVVSSLALPLATLVTNTALQLNNQIVPLNCLRIKDVLFYFQLLKQKKFDSVVAQAQRLINQNVQL